ncbi:bacillithiol biosynthesis cysteine-adding enzyme BshC [Caldibacillus lycopersici]|uniref:Putative cysteine ligase BshC n=1 Tax=Perspicuibacillus lycopersici TaxID=1325689 RepID=A0AAE3LM00_9BACI|nr:bacillithiol biosynthesis cysteine-adding enzyme BshC [Perspicuibacillus lycopersici]MCU9612207.1 bacillithiol biosynthesis cysteine-adding enzyme BshC [Perspicuibacillus lycopersici]
MEMLQLNIEPSNSLVKQYITNEDVSYFHYSFRSVEDDKKRYSELMERVFPRSLLVEHIRSFMKPYSLTEEIEASLAKLEQPNSVVVVGGQQAGLLTGPLYSIHKMLSIIVLAKEKEKTLGVPVVPIFWIAGEDHDIFEVNHVYTVEDNRFKKKAFHQRSITDKQMVSKVKLDKEKLHDWYLDVVATFGETKFSKQIIQLLDEALSVSDTYTQFFTYITNQLFKHYGLLMVDSADPLLRKIESEYFVALIENSERITDALLKQQHFIQSNGHSLAIVSEEQSIQLFYEKDGERTLLHYNKAEQRVFGKGVSFTKAELIQIAKENPELLSNNVVTRPIMQEMLFPTIAFIAGPGEIAYWAELKGCFELLDLKMPPIVPRLNISLLERNVEADLQELGISIDHAIVNGVQYEKAKKIDELKDQQLETFINQIRSDITEKYQLAATKVVNFDKSLEPIVQKNSQYVLSQLDYLQNKVEGTVKQKHEILLRKFDRIEQSLHPLNGLQERCWNIFYFFNRYGFDILDELVKLPFEVNGKHYVVKL